MGFHAHKVKVKVKRFVGFHGPMTGLWKSLEGDYI